MKWQECDSSGHKGYYAILSFDSNLRLQAQKARPIYIHSCNYTLYNDIVFNLYFTAVECNRITNVQPNIQI